MSEHEPTFSVEEIGKIADLANLELTGEEKSLFARQFGEILAYFHKLAAVDTTALEHAGDDATGPNYREDRAVPSGIGPDSFSPYLENRHFKVPRVIE